MCGRFFNNMPWSVYWKWLNLLPADRGKNTEARYNITPTQDVPFAYEQDGERHVQDGRWWLVPFFAKEISSKYSAFNARIETVATSGMFKHSLKSRRCLIPASGYFEWTKSEDGGKDPHVIHLPEFQPIAFAGLWAHNTKLDVTSCTIITAPAADEIAHLHHRMPVILKPAQYDTWLDAETGQEKALNSLSDNLGADLVSYRVSREVNSSRAKGSQLIDAVRG